MATSPSGQVPAEGTWSRVTWLRRQVDKCLQRGHGHVSHGYVAKWTSACRGDMVTCHMATWPSGQVPAEGRWSRFTWLRGQVDKCLQRGDGYVSHGYVAKWTSACRGEMVTCHMATWPSGQVPAEGRWLRVTWLRGQV